MAASSTDVKQLRGLIQALQEENAALRKRLAIYEDTGAPPPKKAAPMLPTANTAADSDEELDSLYDADGNPFFELSSKRRVTVSKFKNFLLVRIGDIYEHNGQIKPGKGISLKVTW